MKKSLPFICFLLIVGACASGDEASIIREMIQKGTEYAEKHDIDTLMEYAGPDFKAQPGEYSRKAAKGVLFRAFKYYGNFNIYYPRPFVDVDASKATASATVYFVILRKDYILPDLRAFYDDPQGWIAAVGQKADLYELELSLAKKKGRWKVREARMNPLKGLHSQRT